MDLDQDHAAVAWSNWTAQFKDSPRLRALVQALLEPANTVQAAIKQLRDERWLDTAVGEQLDGIGSILGRPRRISNTRAIWHFGFDGQPYIGGFGAFPMFQAGGGLFTGGKVLGDDDYRRLLRWKLLVNSGYGTAWLIEEAARTLFDLERIAVEDMGNARIRVHIGRQPTPEDSFLGNPLQWLPKAGGVMVDFRTYDPDDDFELSPGNGIFRLISEEGDPLFDESGFPLYGIQ
ncbi:DUF2612 domain-containing protein [Stenotrophomonas maltophilia]